ncbi:LSU ribosomal protein L9p [hydrothermal vent metagenome]|uniref:LSU ribosomal protein L9p n=1 Tax=hydrothermal vent metagenome TaxID=652676 RepID=A0A3B1BM55_9ZZZZ
MKVILNDLVPQLGDAGDTVDVSAGYARNYLVPKKLAFEATPGNIKLYENNLKQRARKISKLILVAQEQKTRIEGAGDLIFSRKAGEDGKLFGSVTSSDIEEILKEKGIEIDRRKITMDRQIKNLGEVDISIKVHAKVTATLKIVVQPETDQVDVEESAPQTDEVAVEENMAEAEAGEETPEPDQPES